MLLTSRMLVSNGVFTKFGGLSLTSDTRTITGMLRFRLGVSIIVQEICHVTGENE